MRFVNDMFMKKPRALKTFLLSGKSAKIEVFFNINCLKKLSDYFEQSGDYRVSFAKIAFYMYQKTDGADERIHLEENADATHIFSH